MAKKSYYKSKKDKAAEEVEKEMGLSGKQPPDVQSSQVPPAEKDIKEADQQSSTEQKVMPNNTTNSTNVSTPEESAKKFAADQSLKNKEDNKDDNDLSDYTLKVIDHDFNTDPFRLPNKDANYEYRFIRDDKQNISIKTSNLLHAFGGWQIVPQKHLVKLGIDPKLISPDGFYRVGDQILVFMPKQLFTKKQQGKVTKAQARTQSIKRLLESGNPTVGGKEIHHTMKGIQTKEQLGFE